jgi:glycine cleavage system transcriptional repressor
MVLSIIFILFAYYCNAPCQYKDQIILCRGQTGRGTLCPRLGAANCELVIELPNTTCTNGEKVNYLVINAIGVDRPGISHQLFRVISHIGCNIIDSKISLFGEEFTLMMFISGSTVQITQAETQLSRFCAENQLLSTMKRTQIPTKTSPTYRLEANIECSDRLGIVETFTEFYAAKDIDIDSMTAKTVKLDPTEKHSELRFQISSIAHVDDSFNLMQLQEDFDQMCSEHDIQGTLNFINTLS